MSTPDASGLGGRTRGLVAVVLIGLCAPLFGFSTFDPSQAGSALKALSLPVILLEWVLILWAALSGFRPIAAIRALPRPISWSLGVWLVAAGIAAALASERASALIFLGFSLTHVLLALALHDRFSAVWSGFRSAALLALATGLVVFAAAAHLLAFIAPAYPGFDWQHFGMGVMNVRHLAFYAVPLAGIGLGLLAASRLERRWWLGAFFAAAGLYFAAWTGGRAPFLAVFVVMIALLAIMGSQGRWKTAGVMAALAALAMPITFATAPDSEHYGLENILGRTSVEAEAKSPSVARRTEMWSQTAEAVRERPLIGHGQNNWRGRIAASYDHNAHPHNAVMQIAFDWGLLGMAAWLVIAIAGLVRIPGWIGANRTVALPALGALGALAFMAMTDGVLFFAYPQFVLAVCAAILASIGRTSDAAPPAENAA